MVNCAVMGCKTRNEAKQKNITFHSFPQEDHILKMWLEATGRHNWIPTKNTRLCSKHFEDHCMRKTERKVYLEKFSVPTLFVHGEPSLARKMSVVRQVQGNGPVECRACLSLLDERGHNLFQPWCTQWAVQGALIASDLAHFADIELSEDDEFSKVICTACFKSLVNVCKFVTKVQKNDKILRLRSKNLKGSGTTENISKTTADNTESINRVHGHSIKTGNAETKTDNISNDIWPQPIQCSANLQFENHIKVEVKQEVLSEDENDVKIDEDWEPTMDIKIEPEEIIAPTQSSTHMNGVEDGYDGTDNGFEEYLDTAVKQEVKSDDELEDVPDLPLDCMLCSKVFNSLSGLKAHVLANHSYGGVKRKADRMTSSPEHSTTTDKDTTCHTCNESFKTHTDLMLHKSTHGEHVCYVCDAKFSTFLQLSRHGPRCGGKRARANVATDRPPVRPQQLTEPTNKSRKTVSSTVVLQESEPVENLHWEVKTETNSKESKDMIVDSVEEIDNSTPEDEQTMDIEQDDIDANISNQDTKHELTKVNIIDKPPEDDISAESVEEKSYNIKTEISGQADTSESLANNNLNVVSNQEQPNINETDCSQSESNISNIGSTKTISIHDCSTSDDVPIVDCMRTELGHDVVDPQASKNRFIEDSIVNVKDLNESPSKQIPNHSIKEMQTEQILVKSETKTDVTNETDRSNEINTEELNANTSQVHETNESNTHISIEELISSNSLENKPAEEFAELSLGRIEDCYSLSDSVTSLHNKYESRNTDKSEIQDSIEEEMNRIFVEDKMEVKISPIDNENIIPVIPEVSESNMKELNEMKVHLAINPLNKDREHFDSEVKITDIECAKSENCESKLLTVTSEQSN